MGKLSEGSAGCAACRGPGRTEVCATDTSASRAPRASAHTLAHPPAPRPGPRQRRGRSKACASVARKPCPLAPLGRGLEQLTGSPGAWGNFPKARPDAPHALVPEGRIQIRTLLTAERRGLPRTLTPTPAPRPGPRQRRKRSKARAPVARKPSPLAPQREGLNSSPDRRGAWGNLPKKGRHAYAPHAVVPEKQRYVRRTLLPAERCGLRRPPHPTPRSAPRPTPPAWALEGTRAGGAQIEPPRPAGRGA